MSIRLYSRTDAGLRKPRCSTPMYSDGRVQGVGRHWPGTTTDHLSDDPEDVARYLQGWQDYHMDERGWCDIAYQYAVDLSGGVWTLRGFHNRSGAHTPWNEEYYAVLCVVGQFDQPTPSLLEGLAYLRRKALERTPSAVDWKGHGQLQGTSTQCPGEFIRAITLSDLEVDEMGTIDNTAANKSVIEAAVRQALERARPYRSSSVKAWAESQGWEDVSLRYMIEIITAHAVQANEGIREALATLAKLAPLVADAADMDASERGQLATEIAAQVDKLRVIISHDETPA